MGRNLVDLCEQFQQVIIAQFVCPTSRQSPIIDTVQSHLLRQDPDHNIVNFRLSECPRDSVFYSVLLALPNGSFIQIFRLVVVFRFSISHTMTAMAEIIFSSFIEEVSKHEELIRQYSSAQILICKKYYQQV